jgi:hypothetical protein
MRVPAAATWRLGDALLQRVAHRGGAVLARLDHVEPERRRVVVERRRRGLRGARAHVGDLSQPDQLAVALATTIASNSSGRSKRPSSRIERCSRLRSPADRRRDVLRAERADDLVDADREGRRSVGRTSTLSCALSAPTTLTCATPAIARSSPAICSSASCGELRRASAWSR